jgi:hypothetical protein|nr:MAG TPA: hypothetical protein [Caudoviricetes sp.]
MTTFTLSKIITIKNKRAMKYVSHKGKTVRVSDRRYNEYLRKVENINTWLSFRIKILGFSKEELVMNPSNVVIFCKGLITDKDGKLHFPKDKEGNLIVDNREVYFSVKEMKFFGGYYCGKLLPFNTPEEAYEYANSLPLIG